MFPHIFSLTRLYTVVWQSLSFHLDIPIKMKMDSSKSGKWNIPFDGLRVKLKLSYEKWKENSIIAVTVGNNQSV